MVFEPLQGWGLPHCPGQPVPRPDYSFSKDIFPNIQSEPPLIQLEAIDSRPIASYLGEETNPRLITPSCQAVVESDKVPPHLLFSRLNIPVPSAAFDLACTQRLGCSMENPPFSSAGQRIASQQHGGSGGLGTTGKQTTELCWGRSPKPSIFACSACQQAHVTRDCPQSMGPLLVQLS